MTANAAHRKKACIYGTPERNVLEAVDRGSAYSWLARLRFDFWRLLVSHMLSSGPYFADDSGDPNGKLVVEDVHVLAKIPAEGPFHFGIAPYGYMRLDEPLPLSQRSGIWPPVTKMPIPRLQRKLAILAGSATRHHVPGMVESARIFIYRH